MTCNKPIAVFDSGLGGLTVVRQIMRRLPAESIVYFGDTARVPYGIKSADTVTRFAQEDIEFLRKFDPKLIIAACNTASAVALPRLIDRYEIPMCGVVEPGALAAVQKTRNRRVAVIGTEATVSSGAYTQCIRRLAPDVTVIARACPLLVPIAEEGRTNNDAVVLMVLREYLAPLQKADVDTLVLGCTHYPLLKGAIRKVMGQRINIVDSARETARVAAEMLDAACASHSAATGGKPEHRFFASDHPERFARLGKRFLGNSLDNVTLVQPEFIGSATELRAEE